MADLIDRRSYVPLYVQIREQLRRMLAERKPNERFPTDDELARLFRVSRMTVRQAVKDLVDRGLLYRVRGLGTFLSPPHIDQRLDRLRDFFEQWFWQGKAARAEVLAFGERSCPEWVAPLLRLPPGEGILYVHRLRYADEVPVALDQRYFPLRFGRRFGREEIAHQSIFKIFGQKLGIDVIGGQMEIEAAKATADEAGRLKVKTGDPLLLRRMTFFSSAREPLWSGKSVFRSDLYKYSAFVPVAAEPPREG